MSPRKALPAAPMFWSYSIWTVVLGLFLMEAPLRWYGRTWFLLPFTADTDHPGFWIGLVCHLAGFLQIIALARDANAGLLSLLFLFSGLQYWTLGIAFFFYGLTGHGGLMEAPFIWVVGAWAIALSAEMMSRYRASRRAVRSG